MLVALVTTLWKREALERFTLGYYSRLPLPRDFTLVCIAVGSEGEASQNRCAYGWNYIEAPNSPLSEKHQCGIDAARKWNPDCVALINSDTLLSASYFAQIPERTGAGALAFQDMWFLQLGRNRLGYFAGSGITLGAGRCFSRAFLDACDWRLWSKPEPCDRLLDTACEEHVQRHGLTIRGITQADAGVFAMDVKSAVNLWPFRHYRYASTLRGAAVKALLSSHNMDAVMEVAA